MKNSKILSKLERFEDRLAIVDTKMRPIQDTTNTYSRAKSNIKDTITEVEKTYEFFRIANEVDAIISHGYGEFPHLQFFDAIVRLNNAKRFFENNRREIKSSNTALVHIENLLNVRFYYHFY